MTANEMIEAIRVLRDEVLETAEHGDREPPGSEVFDGVLHALASTSDSRLGSDSALQDAVARRLAWGDQEEVVLSDAQGVFDRLLAASERAFRRPDDRMAVIEVATAVTLNVGRAIALAAVTRASRDRAARVREENAQRQLKEVLERQRAAIQRLEREVEE
jgi:hypothetical protein